MGTLVTQDQVAREAPVTTRKSLAGALLAGADYRALGVARSLGRRGIPVWMIKQGGHLVGITSRYVSRRVDWPAGDDDQKVDFLTELSARYGLKEWLLIPTDDYAVALTACHHERLANHYRLTTPPWDALRWGCDKRCLHSMAQRAGVAQPWTTEVVARDELADMDCPFPVILKPAIRMRPSSLKTPKAWLAADRDSLLAAFDQASQFVEANTLLVQEMVPGGGEGQFSYAALSRDGSALASVVARRTRQFPLDFGQFSTYVETLDDPGIVKPAERLLALMRFTGLVELEFKRDLRDGQCKLLDFNPRVWGWHTLCGRAGVDFPYLLWLLMRDEPVPEVRARSGERWMHLSADLWVAAREIFRGHLSAWDYLRELLGEKESAIFARDDPLPGVLDLPLFVVTAARRKIHS